MPITVSGHRLRVLLNHLRERLWVKPLAIALLSVAAAFASRLADGTGLGRYVPEISVEAIVTLLSIMAASMLVIATFSLASMVSAYASASSVATPRTFSLVVSDDVSQNALSTFIGAFIFSIVALTALKNGYFGTAGLFSLFALTVIVFGMVIFTFVRWVDGIARLGRLGTTIDKVEKAAGGALERRRLAPTLHGAPVTSPEPAGRPVFAATVGYVQHVDVAALQAWAARNEARIRVTALPGAFASPGRALAHVTADPGKPAGGIEEVGDVAAAFQVGGERRFDDDPRFGLVVLSEIAGRALSPAVNDPGTAIDVVGTLVRLFVLWGAPATAAEATEVRHDRVEVPAVSIRDMFDDAFTSIARDGAGSVEVAIRLQKALHALALAGDPAMRDAARHHGLLALARAEKALDMAADIAALRAAAAWTESAVTR